MSYFSIAVSATNVGCFTRMWPCVWVAGGGTVGGGRTVSSEKTVVRAEERTYSCPRLPATDGRGRWRADRRVGRRTDRWTNDRSVGRGRSVDL